MKFLSAIRTLVALSWSKQCFRSKQTCLAVLPYITLEWMFFCIELNNHERTIVLQQILVLNKGELESCIGIVWSINPILLLAVRAMMIDRDQDE